MKMNEPSQRGYQGEEHYYYQEKLKPSPPPWQRYRPLVIALLLAALFIIATFISGKGFIKIPAVTPAPAVTPTVTTSGTWQGQFTYYLGEPYSMPFQATLRIPPYQGGGFTGTLFEPTNGNTTVSVSGLEGGSSLFSQNQLQYVTQLYGNGAGTFIEFTDLAYIEGDQIQLNCTYIAVVYVDGSLHGVWFYPGSTQPDGTFILNKVS